MTRIKLTSRGRYAIIALIEIAAENPGKPLPLSEISERAQISLSYLEQLFAGLRKHNIVKSYRGPGGGYVLADGAVNFSISRIMQAAEDSTPAKRDSVSTTGVLHDAHPIHDLWGYIEENLHNTLQNVTLDDVMNRRIG